MSSAQSQFRAVNWTALAVFAAASAVLVVHATSYPFVTYDDAFISLRYAERLLDGHGLTWTEGPPVEGYSNLLWVLACALLGALGVPLVQAPVILGIGSAIALIAAIVHAFPPSRWNESLPALAGAMFMALAGPIGLWAVSGLEGCLVAALLAWSIVLLRPWVEGGGGWRRAWVPGLPLALLCLTRADGPLVTAAVCTFLLVRARSRDAVLGAFAVGALPAIATLGQVGFRLAYYGDWLPNTAHAKVAFTAARLESGATCVAEAARSSYALWLPAAFALYVAWKDEKRRPAILLLTTLLAVWLAYASSVTCQEFGYRMLIPCYVVLAFLVAEALAWLQSRGRSAKAVGWVAAAALLATFGRAQQRDKNIAIARWNNPPVTVQAATIGNVLGAAFGDDDPLLAVDAAGAIPFYSRLRALDMLGLNDAHIARHHDPSFGHGVQGHELGDGAYVLSREPDIIVSGVTGMSRLAFRGGRQMESDPRYHEQYRRVRMFGDDPAPTRFNIHVRLEGRVGVERAKREVRVPGHLLAGAKGTQARLSAGGTLATHFLMLTRTELEGVSLPAGTWRLSVRGDGTLAPLLRSSAVDASGTRTAEGIQISLVEPASVTIAVEGRPPSRLDELVLTRVGP